MKYLLDKEKIYENWLNPVLDGGTIGSSGINLSNFDCADDTPLIYHDQPSWMTNDHDIDYSEESEGNFGTSGPLSIASYFINGIPLTSWSARIGGNSVAAYRHNMMQSFYYTDTILQRTFPNGIQLNLKKKEILEFKIKKLKILKMLPVQSGLAFDIFITFELEDIENEFWGKFVNVGLDREPKLQCNELSNFSIEKKIKIKGKLWNFINNWFSVKSGIYKIVSNELLVYTEFGQLKKLYKDNIIDVLYSDENRIKLIFKEQIYIIKKPTYYWFNWYVEKV